MERIQRLPQMALTDLQPCFYDIESVSTVEMVAKLYKYVQNMVDDYNSYTNEINSIIDEFEKGIIHDFECFKNCVTKTMNDYIESVDTRIDLQNKNISEKFAEQDSIIQDAINYMKTNLTSTINELFSNALENGDIVATLQADYNENNEDLNLYIEGQGGNL